MYLLTKALLTIAPHLAVVCVPAATRRRRQHQDVQRLLRPQPGALIVGRRGHIITLWGWVMWRVHVLSCSSSASRSIGWCRKLLINFGSAAEQDGSSSVRARSSSGAGDSLPPPLASAAGSPPPPQIPHKRTPSLYALRPVCMCALCTESALLGDIKHFAISNVHVSRILLIVHDTVTTSLTVRAVGVHRQGASAMR